MYARGACPKPYLPAAHVYHKITIVSSGKTECVSPAIVRSYISRGYIPVFLYVYTRVRHGEIRVLARFQNVHFSRTCILMIFVAAIIQVVRAGEHRVKAQRRVFKRIDRSGFKCLYLVLRDNAGISAETRAVTLLHNYASITQLRAVDRSPANFTKRDHA